MKNRKSDPQNRIKGFFLEKEKHGKSRIKEIDEKEDKDRKERPEEQDDLS